MSDAMTKPLPEPTPDSAEYWARAVRGELMIQRCRACARHQFYPRMVCAACSSREIDWVRAAGTATVRSFTIVRRPVSEAFAAQVPYVVALVALDEGPVMMTNIVGCAPERVRIGMRVTVAFERWSDTVTVPQFTLLE